MDLSATLITIMHYQLDGSKQLDRVVKRLAVCVLSVILACESEGSKISLSTGGPPAGSDQDDGFVSRRGLADRLRQEVVKNFCGPPAASNITKHGSSDWLRQNDRLSQSESVKNFWDDQRGAMFNTDPAMRS